MKENKKITTLIVDDEDLARLVLRELVQTHPEITIAAECANGFEAVKAVAEHKPDLIFLDVQMPKLSGFDVLELIGTDTAVIFVTAYDQYAMRAFEVHAVDYLLKPIGRERFEAALERAKSRIGKKLSAAGELAAAARPPKQFLERIVVRDGTRVTLIPVRKLDYAEAQDDYVALVQRFICSVTYFLGRLGRRTAQLVQHSNEIPSREPPLERLGDGFVMSLESQQTVC